MTPQRVVRGDAVRTPILHATARGGSTSAILLLFLAIPGAAAAASPSARLTYVRTIDAASCPDEAALREAVAVRFGYDPFFPWAKKTVVVHIGHEGRRYIAHVELVDDSGLTRGTRDLHAEDADCAQIFDATALAISIALDAFAASSGEPAPPEAPLQRPSAPESAGPPPPSPPFESTSTIPSGRASTPFLGGVDVLGSVGAAPGPTGGLGVFVAARSRAASVELRLHADASSPISLGPVGRVQTTRFAATLAPCAHWGLAFACGIGELGWLRASGSDLDVVRSEAAPFIAAGGRLGVAVPVSDTFSLRIYAEGAFDLDRPRFELDYYDVWVAPLIEGTLAIGLVRRIP